MRARLLTFALCALMLGWALALAGASGPAASPVVTGSISGAIKDNDTSNPLSGIPVWIYRSNGTLAGTPTTGADGLYALTDLPEGTYYARTWTYSGYINEVWNAGNDNQICFYMCAYQTLGTPIVVSAVSALDHTIDFGLTMGTFLDLAVIDDTTGNPIPGMGVDLWGSGGNYLRSAWMQPDGTNLIEGVPPGTYFLNTSNFRLEADERYVSELWQDLPCPLGCTATDGTPVVITPGQARADVTFELHQAGKIFGHVNHALTGGPLANVRVNVFDESGGRLGFVTTDADGNYTVPGVPYGTYYLATGSTNGYLDELFDGRPCPRGTCVVTAGDPVTLTSGAWNQSASFSLAPSASITGTVWAAAGPVLSGVGVKAYDVLGRRVGSAVTNASGVYTISGLTPGWYLIATNNTFGYIDEVNPDVACPFESCNVLTGRPVPVTSGTPPVVDFWLEHGGMLGGSVTDGLGVPIAGALVQVYDSHGAFVTDVETPGTGLYLVDGLPAGTYYARTWTGSRFIDEIWNDKPCAGWCVPTSGDGIVVSAGAGGAAEANFVLQPGGSISGEVIEQDSGAPIAGLRVLVYDDAGNLDGYVDTSAGGKYTVAGLPAGTYHVRTTGRTFLNQVWKDLPCLGLCGATAGTPVTVGTGETPGIDFVLARGGRILGAVLEESTGLPLSGALVQAFDAGGNLLTSATSNAAGAFTLAGLPTGTFFITASGLPGYIPVLYEGEPYFVHSDVTAGTGIDVTAGADVTDLVVKMVRGHLITGDVTRSDDGSNAPATIEVYDDLGRRALSFQALGHYESPGLPDGTYYVKALGQDGLLGMLFSALPCPLGRCDALDGSAVTFGAASDPTSAGVSVATVDFMLQSGGRIMGHLTPGGQNGPVSVEVYDAAGLATTAAEQQSTSAYITQAGLPPGSFFAKAVNPTYQARVWEGVACPGNTCSPLLIGNPIPVVANAVTVADFVFPACPAITVDPGVVAEALAGRAYSQSFTARGGTGPYVFSSIGRLPAGLLMSETGTLAGTVASTGGWFRAVIRAADTRGCLGERSIYLPVVDAAPLPPPSVASIDPSEGPEAGGTTITITGADFQDGAIVTVGGEPATGVVFVSATVLTAVTPPLGGAARPLTGTGTTVDVTVINPDKQEAMLADAFTYLAVPAPTLISVTPASGPASGGTHVTLTGTGFVSGATVTFGGAPASGVVVFGPTMLTAVTPPLDGGAGPLTVSGTPVDVEVVNPDQQCALLQGGFTYVLPPVVDSIDPVVGPTAGGTTVTIYGMSFQDGATVAFGALPAAGVTWLSDTTLEAVTPAAQAGTVDVVVTNPGGQASTLAAAFTFLNPPTLTGITPSAGPADGGTPVTLTGTGFLDGATVAFGGEEAYDVVVVTATLITATTPGVAVGGPAKIRVSTQVDVVVTNPDGQSATLTNGFTYEGPPTVTAVSPDHGPAAGNTLVTITGADFKAGANVYFDGVEATSVAVVSATEITARTPEGYGLVEVSVENPDGQTGTLIEAFTYLSPPEVYGVDPMEGFPAGGLPVTIYGANFAPGAVVLFDALPAGSVVVVDAETITATTPAHAPGAVDVLVRNADGQEGLMTEGFTYLEEPPDLRVSAFSAPPAAGPGQTITVRDTTANAGRGTAPFTTTAYFLSEDNVLDDFDEWLDGREVPELAPGRTSTGSLAVLIPDYMAAGTYYLIARADAYEEADEASETNNTFARLIRIGADLVVTALHAPPGGSPGDVVTVSDTTKNLGPGTAPETITAYYLSNDAVFGPDDTYLSERAVPPIKSGQAKSGSVAFEIPPVEPGTYYILAVADHGEAVPESHEDNNVYSRAFRIGPDLVVSGLGGPAATRPGAPINVRDTTKNTGVGTAAASTTTIYWSTDAVWDAGDVVLGTRAVPALAPGRSSVFVTPAIVPAGATPGMTYYLIARADSDEAVAELSEANNTKTKAIRVK